MVSPFAQGTSSENNVGDRVQEEEEKRTTAQWCFYESTELCVTVATRPQGVLVTAPQVVSEMLLRGEAEAAKEEKLTLFQKKE
ncbi:hypothetical protein L1987_88748 [Smallanthus sonchifolius]|nr:hypothetical protein L1987_88748 [Smallanthus sonchifolius]